MGHVENKREWCIDKARKEGVKHRGLKEVPPDREKTDMHLKKAEHNLRAMMYLIKGGFPDWAVNASFYARYHCLLAILSKYGYESRNQECTFAAVEHIIGKKVLDLDKADLLKISATEDGLEKATLIQMREDSQYGTTTSVDEPKMKELLEDTKEFIQQVKVVLAQ